MRKLLFIIAVLAFSSIAFAPKGLKIYISADMEGPTGVVTGDQLGPGGFEYERFRQIMTDTSKFITFVLSYDVSTAP